MLRIEIVLRTLFSWKFRRINLAPNLTYSKCAKFIAISNLQIFGYLIELTAGRRFETAVPDVVITTAGLRDPLA